MTSLALQRGRASRQRVPRQSLGTRTYFSVTMLAMPPPRESFATTHWSRVIAAKDEASPEARAALAQLCADYWYPLYAYVRRRGHDADGAHDLTQAFFARLLEKGSLRAADQARGRFRSFLLTSLQHFL